MLNCVRRRKLFFILSVAVLMAVSSTETVAATNDPVLLTDSTSTRAIALDSMTWQREPFPLTQTVPMFAGQRTRVMLFAMNLTLLPGEGTSVVTADAMDAGQRIYPLTVEYVGTIPNQSSISYVVVRLPDGLSDNAGDVLVGIKLRGVPSNRARIGIGSVGGGPGDEWFVSPSGTSAGSGSSSNPLSLSSALNSPRVKPGSVIWLRGGTYRGAFQSTLRGTENAPIIVRQYPGERAIIDGNGFMGQSQNAAFTVYGEWATYWGFEVMNSNPNRSTPASGQFRQAGVVVKAPYTKFINMVVHDTGMGFSFWKEAVDSELYGNIIYNCGSLNTATNNQHGHGIYTQNEVGTKLIRDNIIFNQFGNGLKIYPNPGNVAGYYVEGNILFNNGVLSAPEARRNNILVWSYAPFTSSNITLNENYSYLSPATLAAATVEGYYKKTNVTLGQPDLATNGSVTLTNNYFVGGTPAVSVDKWENVTTAGNTFVSQTSSFWLWAPQYIQTYQMDDNSYFGSPTVAPFLLNNQPMDFTGWKQLTSLDQRSSYTAGKPAGVKIVVRPNRYEPGRAHIVVFNWDRVSMVDVDVSSVLEVGSQYEVRNVQDYTGQPVQVGTYYGGAIRLPMTGLRVAAPIGSTAPPPTEPEFNTFVLIKR